MHRIDSNGSVDGQFQAGNPAVGQQATQLDAAWHNSVQEELCAVIENAGIGLDKEETDQLYQAIVALVAGVVGDGSGAVPTTRTITAAGLATGGGDLAANRTITVAKASAAEVSALTNDTKAVTPLALAGLVGLTVSGTAWIINIGPTVLQIFNATASANGTTVVSLPQAYSDECRVAWCNGGRSENDAQDNDPFVSGRGLTSVSVWSARDENISVQIVAIGK